MQSFCLGIIQNYKKSWRKVFILDSLECLKQEHREMIIYKFRVAFYFPMFTVVIFLHRLLLLKNKGYFRTGFDQLLDEAWGVIVSMSGSVGLATLTHIYFTYQLFKETDVLYEEYLRLGKLHKLQIEIVENPPDY